MLAGGLLLFAVVPLILFIYRYARFSPWKSTIAGITLMAQKVVLLGLIGYLLAAVVVPEFTGKGPFGYVLLALLGLLLWMMLLVLVWTQNETRPVSKRMGQIFLSREDLESTAETERRKKRKR